MTRLRKGPKFWVTNLIAIPLCTCAYREKGLVRTGTAKARVEVGVSRACVFSGIQSPGSLVPLKPYRDVEY